MLVNKIKNLKLGKKLGTLIGFPTFLAFVGIVVVLMFSVRAHDRSKTLESANRAFDYVLLAAGEQARERGFTSTVLANPKDLQTFARINELRQRGDSFLDSALAIAKEYSKDNTTAIEQYNKVTNVRQKRDQFRREADAVLTKSVAEAAFISKWFEVQTELIMQENNLARTLFASDNRLEKVLEFNSLIKNSIFQVSEFAGRERATIGQVIGSGRPIEPETLNKLMKFRGVVEENLRTVVAYKSNTAITPNIRAAIEEMEQAFLGNFEKVRQSVYAASAKKEPYPLTSSEWIQRSTQAINSVLKVSDVLSQEVQVLVADERAGSVSNIILVALALLGLATTIVLSVWIAKLIIRPTIAFSTAARQVADGDLTQHVVVESTDEIGQVGAAFNKMVESLRQVIGQVGEASSAVASASSEISSSTEQMAAGAQEQSAQAGEVASAVEEMTKTIIENSRNASNAADIARKAKESAERGGKVVEETVGGMQRIAEVVKKSAQTVQELGKSSDQIGEIISVIDDIADQTNLLALNAAIEAARAGEQGRGFAVVADEVRKLAERTTKATKEIAGMIKKIQTDTAGAVRSMDEGTKEVDKGIQLADQAGVALKEIVEVSQSVTDMIAQIAAASEEQSSASEQISKNVEAISTVTQQTASGTQQIARAAEDLNRLTENLQRLVSRFRLNSESDQWQESVVSKGAVGHLAVQPNGTIVRNSAKNTKFDIEAAKSAHKMWRLRVQKLLLGEESFEGKDIVSHRDCKLGKWYYGRGQSEFGGEAVFVELGQKHEEMHDAVKKVARLWHDGQREAAEREAEKVYRLSDQVVRLLDELATVSV